MNPEVVIRNAVEKGKVLLGARETLNATHNKKAKMVIVSSNCPASAREDLERYSKMSNVRVYRFKGTSMELGSVCGKPFSISMLTVLDPGESEVLELKEEAV